ncbi:MAG: hypothetical protein AAF434_13300 [Pseudomonadota bacterium]
MHRKSGSNLRLIKGIGESTERWLNDSLGVFTYEQLANLSSDRIEAESKKHNKPISATHIKSWIAEAGKLAEKSPGAEEKTYSKKSAKSGKEESANWYPLATFIIEFQSDSKNENANLRTVCQQNETAREQSWSNLDTQSVCRWISSQLEEQNIRIDNALKYEPEQHADESNEATITSKSQNEQTATDADDGNPGSIDAAIVEDVNITIEEVRLLQSSETPTFCAKGKPGGRFTGIAVEREPLSVEVEVHLSGKGAKALTEKQLPVTVEIHAYNRTKSTRIRLKSFNTVTTTEDTYSYVITCTEAMLLQGEHAVECYAMIAGPPAVATHARIPFLFVKNISADQASAQLMPSSSSIRG